jgi:chorismate dehydratase
MRLSASSYSNTAPLIWSFLYGSNHGQAELILDNAPARSAQLLAEARVDALVPIVAYQQIEGVRLVPDVCVGTKGAVRSVCLVTRGADLTDVRSIALDTSSKTSVVLTKIIFREFLPREPSWHDATPDIEQMLSLADCALLIGDPALKISASPHEFRVFDLGGLWHEHTGLGFVFAMWMTRGPLAQIDLAAARDEGLGHIRDISANYAGQIGLSREEIADYLTTNIAYSIDENMHRGAELYFDLAAKHGLIPKNKSLEFV